MRMIYCISLIQRQSFCFTFTIFEIRMHLIIDVVLKTNWQCVPCCFFAPFLIRYIPMVYLTIKGGVCVCVSFSCSVVSNSFATPWTVARQAPLSMEFPWQQYWSGLPFPSPEDLLNPGIKLLFPALAGGYLTTVPPGKP